MAFGVVVLCALVDVRCSMLLAGRDSPSQHLLIPSSPHPIISSFRRAGRGETVPDADQVEIDGRIAGREGGTITIAAPGLEAGEVRVTVQSRVVPHKTVDGGVAFTVEIAARDGCKEYRLEKR
ncbi:MAG TPA: hypothetical protein VM186_11055 [Planctomycetota bacterium]|nr:hypothetical protein [Planctomycetota bacterium]